jgi:L-rhamnose mutarotase
MKTNISYLITLFAILFITSCSNCEKMQDQKGTTSNIAQAVKVERYGMVTGLKPEKVEAYKKLHAAAWPAVLKKITECNISNYSIYLKEVEGKPYLFSYWEYTGKDFDADMKIMAADTTTQRWWKETSPMQLPVTKGATEVSAWSRMEEVFHLN